MLIPAVVVLCLTGSLVLLPAVCTTASAEPFRGPLADSAAVLLGTEGERTTWGILAVSLDRGDTLLSLSPGRRLIPGSNQKILTAGAFLRRFGGAARRDTEILARGRSKLRRGGQEVEFKGDLVLRGCGMPDVSALIAPGSRALLDSVAFRLRESGLTELKGTVWVDGSLFAVSRTPRGWSVEDLPHGYGAPVNAILANGNAASVIASATVDGATRVTLDPPDAPLTLQGVVSVGDSTDPGRLEVDRAPNSRVVRVTGIVPRGRTVRRTVSFPEPDSTAGLLLLGALERAGVRVHARVRVGDPAAPGTAGAEEPAGARAVPWSSVREGGFARVLRHPSPPAGAVLAAVLSYSLNPESEALLRLLDPAPSGKSPEAALRELRATLWEAGIDSAEVSPVDGSGLSTQNLVTPRALVRWLVALAQDTTLGVGFATLLPAPGGRGTMEKRLAALAADSTLHAKTGTLTNVSALSGYLTTREGERLVFSILSNGNRGTVAPARAVEDSLVGLLHRAVRARRAEPAGRPPVWGIPR